MYCTNCGKQINYGSSVCAECARAAEAKANGGWQNGAQNGAYQSYYSFEPISPEIFDEPQAAGGEEGRKAGLVRAIIAAVLTQIPAFFLTPLMGGSLENVLAVILLGVLPCAIVALCFGIASIRCFREARRRGDALPIPTLIIGIYATVNAASLLLVCLLLSLVFLL